MLVDRAVGGSSLEEGQLEIMLDRRYLLDDGKGIGETVDERNPNSCELLPDLLIDSPQALLALNEFIDNCP